MDQFESVLWILRDYKIGQEYADELRGIFQGQEVVDWPILVHQIAMQRQFNRFCVERNFTYEIFEFKECIS